MYLDISTPAKVIITIIMCILSTLSTTVYLHRFRTHKALRLNRVVQHIFQIILWLNTGIKSALWVLIHTKHHSQSDRKDDLHSPKNSIKILGRKITGPIVPTIKYFYLYKDISKNVGINKKMLFFLRKEDEVSIFLYHKLSLLGPVILLTTYLLLFGYSGIWMFTIQFLNLPIIAGTLINGFGHNSKESHEETRDYSSNLLGFIDKLPKWIYYMLYPLWFCLRLIVDLITGGEWRHYAHHFKLDSARITLKKFEIDTGWIVIYFLYLCRLANNIKYYSSGKIKELKYS